MSSRLKRGIIVLLVLAFIWIVVNLWVSIYPDFLWFKSLSYGSVFTKILFTKILIGTVVSIIIMAIFLGNLYLIKKFTPSEFSPTLVNALPFGSPDFNLKKYIYIVLAVLGVFFSIIWGYAVTSRWEILLRFLNSKGLSFGITDPIFNKGVEYYVFRMPFLRFICSWLLTLFFITSVLAVIIYFFQGALLDSRNRFTPSFSVKTHVFSLIGLTLLLKAWSYRFAMYDLLYKVRRSASTRGKIYYGGGYADIHARLPVLWILLVLCVIVAIIFFVSIFLKKIRYAGAAFAILLVVGFFGRVYPWVVQMYRVGPNEQDYEIKYIGYGIKYTRNAYNLGKANVDEKEYPLAKGISMNDVKKNNQIISNIRLWDWRPLKEVFSQFQALRPQYNFVDIDTDRYEINGHLRQVMYSARELDYDNLPASVPRTWYRRTFVYTHGYGICIIPVNKITEDGRPEWYVEDIPLSYYKGWPYRISDNPGPRIYYGEATKYYVIVNPKASDSGGLKEFDYPISGKQFAKYAYKGKGGVPISSFMRRLLFTLKFKTYNILLSSEIKDTSKILFYRNINDIKDEYGRIVKPSMLKRLAPFLKFDKDPYLVIHNGRLVWVIDAYTVTSQYPYSEPMESTFKEEVATKRGLRAASRVIGAGRPWGNYIRNSVKVVVDAYDGTVTFYMVNKEKDPLIQCYNRMFKGMFKPFAQMDEDLKKHIRYPMTKFMIQARKYTDYHMKDAITFYAGEDLWQVGRELYGPQEQGSTPISTTTPFGQSITEPRKGNSQEIQPYYVIIRFPDQKKAEYILMLPYTPADKPNLRAWLAARCDLPQYGKLRVYEFPKGELASGPMQIENFIDNNPNISPSLTLWGQKGSEVIRGNLLVIPMANSLLYVEPIYVRASGENSILELRRVVVGYKEKVVWAKTLDEALVEMFVSGKPEAELAVTAEEEVNPSVQGKPPITAGKTVKDLVSEARQHYDEAQSASRSGDWAKYGEELKKLQQTLKILEEKTR